MFATPATFIVRISSSESRVNCGFIRWSAARW